MKYNVSTAVYTFEADSPGSALKQFLDQPEVIVLVKDPRGIEGYKTFKVAEMPRVVRARVLKVLGDSVLGKVTARVAVEECIKILEEVNIGQTDNTQGHEEREAHQAHNQDA